MNDAQKHQHCTTRFIELANELKDEGYDVKLVSAALMSASGIYATYSVAGNSGGLTEKGVEKVVGFYKRNLEQIQASKKVEADRIAKQNADG